MNVEIFDTKQELGVKSAAGATNKIKQTMHENGTAHIILATGASQFETLKNLVEDPGIDW